MFEAIHSTRRSSPHIINEIADKYQFPAKSLEGEGGQPSPLIPLPQGEDLFAVSAGD